jgi:hypothetical protein
MGAFAEALVSTGPAAEHAEELMLFGQFVGAWAVEVELRPPDGPVKKVSADWIFEWVLQGRAVQDLYIVPPRAEQERTGEPAQVYGTTLRLYDPESDNWLITWASPLSATKQSFVARREGDEIVLEGVDPEGKQVRWIFYDIADGSYRWRADAAVDGDGWKTVQAMTARRVRG